ncbi:MAG: hypothetical protein ACE5ES_02670 [Candidatus Nanoarchaeia archaeon]
MYLTVGEVLDKTVDLLSEKYGGREIVFPEPVEVPFLIPSLSVSHIPEPMEYNSIRVISPKNFPWAISRGKPVYTKMQETFEGDILAFPARRDKSVEVLRKDLERCKFAMNTLILGMANGRLKHPEYSVTKPNILLDTLGQEREEFDTHGLLAYIDGEKRYAPFTSTSLANRIHGILTNPKIFDAAINIRDFLAIRAVTHT